MSSGAAGWSSGAPSPGPSLETGTFFGPYRIGRLLGRGGMGEVYEAEHLEQGRRVALKVLGQHMQDPKDRARFLREGQLAASISHPHTVYIFGSEVIAGAPVIAMELLPGGTLRDRVSREGPLAPGAAVDATLQVVAGLDAANAAGILHRDVKPANCFVDRDGTVKVGDFGLSISTLARDVSDLTVKGTFQGTPEYASPEQLRGRPLDVRSDIYAVGGLLYYLLTGRPPFDERSLVDLVARVTSEQPRSPRVWRRRVPRGLAAIVLRCLAKDPASRPASYAALADDLRVFGSKAPTPATLALRFAAGVVDAVLLAVFTLPLTAFTTIEATSNSASFGVGIHSSPWANVVAFLYFVLLEGVGDGSIGKRLFGLRVAGVTVARAGLARAVGRAALFVGTVWLATAVVTPGANQLTRMAKVLTFLPGFWLGALLFLTARRRNGFAAFHDQVTGTRVVLRQIRDVRPVAAVNREPVEAADRPRRRCGPYEVLRPLGATPDGEILLGFDRVLGRLVWLHIVAVGTPPVGQSIRDAGRPGRLRWLTGQRAAGNAWDAYEALDGMPLAASETPQPWSTVKHWLVDLARELQASADERSAFRLALDRVWITRANRAVLLDFGAPGLADRPITDIASPHAFLHAAANRALAGNGPPPAGARRLLPLRARAALAGLARTEPAAMPDVVGRLEALEVRVDRVTRDRRAVAMALVGLPQILFLLALLTMAPVLASLLRPDVMPALASLGALAGADNKTGVDAERLRTALEMNIAGRLGSKVAQDAFWRTPATVRLESAWRPLARRALAHHPAVSREDLAKAVATLHELDEDIPGREVVVGIVVELEAWLLAAVACMALLSAFAFRGGFWLRLTGLAVVNQDGTEVSRRRAAWRSIVAFLPVWLVLAGLAVLSPAGVGPLDLDPNMTHWPFLLLAVPPIWAGAAWAIVRPERGLQDRIAGTWLVPR